MKEKKAWQQHVKEKSVYGLLTILLGHTSYKEISNFISPAINNRDEIKKEVQYKVDSVFSNLDKRISLLEADKITKEGLINDIRTDSRDIKNFLLNQKNK